MSDPQPRFIIPTICGVAKEVSGFSTSAKLDHSTSLGSQSQARMPVNMGKSKVIINPPKEGLDAARESGRDKRRFLSSLITFGHSLAACEPNVIQREGDRNAIFA